MMKSPAIYVDHPLPDGSVPMLFAGSFNPLHQGHTAMAEYAASQFGNRVSFEISISNVDKADIDPAEIERRAAQFAGRTLYLTRASRFTQKAQLFPGTTFLMGADTFERLIDRKYYRNEVSACRDALRQIVDLGCKFLVFGRLGQRGLSLSEASSASKSFQVPDASSLPASLKSCVTIVPESDFRCDISSTEIRESER